MDKEVQAWIKPVQVQPGKMHPKTYTCPAHGTQEPDQAMWLHSTLRVCPQPFTHLHDVTYSNGKTYQLGTICGAELKEQA